MKKRVIDGMKVRQPRYGKVLFIRQQCKLLKSFDTRTNQQTTGRYPIQALIGSAYPRLRDVCNDLAGAGLGLVVGRGWW